MKYYYKLSVHPDHIGSGLHLANEKFEPITGILRNGEKVIADTVYFVANNELNWHDTLTRMDLIKAQRPIISERAYRILKHFLSGHAQVIPCKIAYKENIYDNFYLLIANIPISLVDAKNSIFDLMLDEEQEEIDAMITSYEFYNEDIKKEIYLYLQDSGHIFYDILLSSPTIVSKNIYEKILENKLNMSCTELYGDDPWFGMHDDHHRFDESPELQTFIREEFKKASNYNLLKNIFDWL